MLERDIGTRLFLKGGENRAIIFLEVSDGTTVPLVGMVVRSGEKHNDRLLPSFAACVKSHPLKTKPSTIIARFFSEKDNRVRGGSWGSESICEAITTR